jgi:5-methylcytosine-specific restriction endonuclease McrA
MSVVLVLNADFGPLQRVSVRHAIRMVFRQVAVVQEARPDARIGVYPIPTVVRLASYVVTRWRRSRGPSWSRPGVLARDERRCAFCGGPASTVDHVLPRSRGGGDTWENTVAACARCNNRKRDRTPTEAGMPLRRTPTAPTWASLL